MRRMSRMSAVGVDEELHVERGPGAARPRARVRIPSTTMTGAGSTRWCTPLGAGVRGEVVDWGLLDGEAALRGGRSTCSASRSLLERVRVVVVHELALGGGQVGLRLVVVVLLEEHPFAFGERAQDGAGDRALPGARAAGDSQDERLQFGGRSRHRPAYPIAGRSWSTPFARAWSARAYLPRASQERGRLYVVTMRSLAISCPMPGAMRTRTGTLCFFSMSPTRVVFSATPSVSPVRR
jgi:hypothetical protein